MTTSDYEFTFYRALQEHLQQNYHHLRCTAPSSGTYISKGFTVPSPDFIVENPSTGATLAIEFKGGHYSGSVPFATVPQMKAMKDAWQSVGARVVLVTVGRVPEPILSGLQKEHIPVTQASSVGEALSKLDANLKALEESV